MNIKTLINLKKTSKIDKVIMLTFLLSTTSFAAINELWVNIDGKQYQCKTQSSGDQPNVTNCNDAVKSFKQGLELCKQSGYGAMKCIDTEMHSLKKNRQECVYEVRSECVTYCMSGGYGYNSCTSKCS